MYRSLACPVGMVTIQKHSNDRYSANGTQNEANLEVTKPR
jgi:hypothetical protein